MAGLGAMIGIGPSAGAEGLAYRPGEAPIVDAVSKDQATTAYNQSQAGIDNQAKFLAAIQAQNGIGNQSAVYNQLAGIANGNGPNPAQNMLNQATAANTANQAALMAGQRGAGANAGLIARQAAQQGAANQQNAAGQAATMQANQQLGAINNMGNLATNQVAQQASATGALTGAQQSEQQLLLNQIAAQNNEHVQNQANINNSNTQMAGAGAKAQAGLIQGLGTGLMAKGGMVPQKLADGGMPTLGVDTTMPPAQIIAAPAPMAPSGAPQGPKSFVGRALSGNPNSSNPGNAGDIGESAQGIGKEMGAGIKSLFSSGSGASTAMPDGSVAGAGNNFGASELQMPSMGGFAKGGRIPVKVSPDEIYLSPDKAKKVAEGKANPKQIGEKIKGKAKVPGDSLKNDTVNKSLESGGVVVKRSLAMDKDDRKAIDFVKAVMAKHRLA